MSAAHQSPLPPAGGAGGGHFQPRDTTRARALRRDASPAERLLWRVLSRRQVAGFKFSRQMPLGPYFADFLCREAMLVIEVDGPSHDLRLAQDRARDTYLAQHGYRVLRFTNDDIAENLEAVVGAIAEALPAAAHPRPLPQAGGETKDDHAQNR